MNGVIYQASRQGGRPYNEDRLLYAHNEVASLLVVADGMGGHANGEVASQLTVDTLGRMFKEEAQPAVADPSGFLLDAIYAAHDAINEHAIEADFPEAPRTTCVACVVQDGTATWAHVGDSRLYHFGQDCFHTHTRDHSMVQDLVDRGIFSADNAHKAGRNFLYNAVGGNMVPDIEVTDTTPLQQGDLLLLCSDGFWDSLKPEEMLAELKAKHLREAVEKLMDMAETRGGPRCDNLTVLALRYGDEPGIG